MRVVIILVYVLVLPWFGYSQYESGITIPDTSFVINSEDYDQVKYASTITIPELKEYLTIISSDEMEGRETGTIGNDLAAAYLAEQIQSLGVSPLSKTPGYIQAINISAASWLETEIKINDLSYRHMWDYLVFPDMNTTSMEKEKEIIFLGYGIDDGRYSDYKDITVKGKSIIIFEGEPRKEDGKYWISGNDKPSFWNNENKLKVAQRKGVKRVYIISNDIKKLLLDNRKKVMGRTIFFGDLLNDPLPIGNHVYISTDMAKSILGEKATKVIENRDHINRSGSSSSFTVKTNVTINFKRKVAKIGGQNVVAFVEGTSKSDEIIVVSAHYDHLGKRGNEIYNGADDNGTGSAAVLEILEAFTIAQRDGKGPDRSILFIWFTSEERGLRGSAYYAEHPLFPLRTTIANVNIDMIGRTDIKHIDNSFYTYVIGSDRLSSELHSINEQVNNNFTNLILDYEYNDENDPNRFYFRSDHYNFAKNGIPSIFFFSGVHEDYHRTSDTIDKIMFDKYQKICHLVFHNIWELANRDARIRVDKQAVLSP